MKEIKTVQFRPDYYKDFDEEVNSLLKDGWILKERLVMPASEAGNVTFHRMYVAYLERETPYNLQ